MASSDLGVLASFVKFFRYPAKEEDTQMEILIEDR